MNWIVLTVLLTALAHAHEAELEGIEVVEHEDSQGLLDFVPSVKKIRGPELTKKRQTSIGDTLSTEAGVQSTTFGPSASRPVIRGLDGDRIRILQNSLGTLDASTQSLDHAVPVDTLTIDQVEIVRGPMSLLYGSSAVGGIVNLTTNRIHYEFENGFTSKFLTQGETVNKGLSNAAHFNYGISNWMFHVDGSTRNLGDQEQFGSKGKLENSFNKQDNVAVATTRIFNRGHAGVSFNHFNTLYGSVAEDTVSIDMTQNRFEFHGEYRPESGPIRKYKVKSAQSDYFHKEIAEGATETIFRNKGNETRVEGLNKSGDWDGVSGIQTQFFDFEAVGDEAFLPENENAKVSAFTFQQLRLGKHALRFGGRLENHEIKKLATASFPGSDEKSYLGMNASLGHCYDFSKTNTLESSVSFTERAPTFQELYAEGDHIATGTYELGDSALGKEKATAFEVTYKNKSDKNIFTGSAYTQVFNNYIALSPTDIPNPNGSPFPVNVYEQVDALFYGVDLDNRSELAKVGPGIVNLLNKFDWVRAKNTDSGDNLPRISPPRLSAGLEYASDKWASDVELMYVAHQTKTAPGESSTDSYYMTNIGYSYNILTAKTSWNLFARVRNIFDVEARNHVSTLKDVAPLPGRNFILGAQFQL